MIYKDVDPKKSTDKFIKAGLAAEKQMAFYLKRAFAEKEDIFVLNDIRLERNGEVAQIDHLIIHAYGFIIVESKSVSSKVIVNKHGEWKRIFNKKENGMPSPIQQAKRQASFLKDFLNQRATNVFRDNIVNKLISKPTFENYKFDVLVAISDSGIIERDSIDLPNVLKADIIPDTILELISKRKKDLIKGILNPFGNDGYSFHKETIQKIANLLFTLHTPLSTQTIDTNIVQEEPITYNKSQNNSIIYSCSKCKSTNLEVAYGRNYYFKCLDCANNIPIKHTCKTSSCKPRTKKRKNQFFKVCKNCGVDELFYENKS
jgi:hypothetical protein